MLLNNVICFIGIAGRVTVPHQYDWFSKEGRSAWETAIDREIISRLLQVCNKKKKRKKTPKVLLIVKIKM